MPESNAQSQAETHQDAVGGVVRVSDVWTLEASEERLGHVRKLIEQYANGQGWKRAATGHLEAWHVKGNEFSGMGYSPDLSRLFAWSADGETFASDDDGVTWILQDGKTTETDEGAFVAGRDPAFVPWFRSRWHAMRYDGAI